MKTPSLDPIFQRNPIKQISLAQIPSPFQNPRKINALYSYFSIHPSKESKTQRLIDSTPIQYNTIQNPRKILQSYSYISPDMKEGKSKTKLHLQQQQNGHVSSFKLAKLLDPEASWDKDQLGDVLHWIRQVIALACGLLWGAVPLVGWMWIVVFLVLSSGIIYGYYAHILKIDEEDYGGHGALLQEGLFASLSLFLLVWILAYSLAHF